MKNLEIGTQNGMSHGGSGDIPRNEFPEPQFMRENWLCLNGQWEFETDPGMSGADRELWKPERHLSGSITVPFCPESRLSGVGIRDFMNALWYAKTVTLDGEQCGNRIFLCFGAVDYECTVYVNGTEAGSHRGGYASFRMEITSLVHPGQNRIVVSVRDDVRDSLTPRGKQSERYHSHDCDYTRTTGIWQTVWMEFVPQSYLVRTRYETDPAQAVLHITAQTAGPAADLCVRAFYEGREVGSACAAHVCGTVTLTVPLSERHLWEVGKGRLYDLILTFGQDRVQSYFGLRSVAMDGRKFLLNGGSVFQRLVLDQGFYPDGVYTAPDDGALRRDIELAISMGFNGARLHQKVFEPRFLYHCDRLGYMVWGEYADWGLQAMNPLAIYGILPEWEEVLLRDRNHPSIIGWCPLNETWNTSDPELYRNYVRLIRNTTQAIDPTRPCIDTSGGIHVETDIYDVHDYEGCADKLREHYADLLTQNHIFDYFAGRQCYGGQAIFASEYGGIRWQENGEEGWGYGDCPKTEEEFLRRFRETSDVFLDHPAFFGMCYTQLTDVEQEQNGLLRADRTPKFNVALLRQILTRKAAVEEQG